jgi:hypothetical protein
MGCQPVPRRREDALAAAWSLSGANWTSIGGSRTGATGALADGRPQYGQ